MRFVPEAVLGMAKTIDPAVEATKAHADRITNVGFAASHAGKDYQVEGQKIAAGVDGLVGMLKSWSDASESTAGVMRKVVADTVRTDEENRAQINNSPGGSNFA